MKNFRELKIWQKGMEIVKNSFQIIKDFPNDVKWSLGQQMQKAAISIPSNIAEGGSRTSIKDYKRFIDISLGSAFELETQLMLAAELRVGDQALVQTTISLVLEEEKMLSSFSRKLNPSNSPTN